VPPWQCPAAARLWSESQLALIPGKGDLAKAFRWSYTKPARAADIVPALSAAFATKGPVMIEVQDGIEGLTG